MPERRTLADTAYAFRWRGAEAALWLAGPAAAGDAVDQALALAPLLPVAPVLEAWLGEPLRLGAARARPGDDYLPIEIGPIGGAAMCTVALPAALLPAGLTAAFAAGWALRWPRIACDLVLDGWPAEAIDESRLEPGAMLLLPHSFDAGAWAVRLEPLATRALPGPARRSAHWRQGDCVLRAGLQDGLESPPVQPWQAVLPNAAAPGADWWCGLAAQAESLAVEPERIELRLRAQTVARGRLAPAGMGLGLLIEQVLRGAEALGPALDEAG